MDGERPTVFIIDDDDSVRAGLERLLREKGYHVIAFSSAEAFLQQNYPPQIACLILDLQLPGLSGLELQNLLARRNILLPTVFISGNGSIPTAVQALRSGAVGFLTKPIVEVQVITEIENALATCRQKFNEHFELTDLQQRFDSLTKREGEIFTCVVSGKLNKQTASDLGLDINTVKVHRRHVMRKMHAESLADLVVMAQKLRMTRHLPSLQSPGDCPPQVLTLQAGADHPLDPGSPAIPSSSTPPTTVPIKTPGPMLERHLSAARRTRVGKAHFASPASSAGPATSKPIPSPMKS